MNYLNVKVLPIAAPGAEYTLATYTYLHFIPEINFRRIHDER